MMCSSIDSPIDHINQGVETRSSTPPHALFLREAA